MRGIVLLNPNFPMDGLHTSESFAIQKIAAEKFVQEQGISLVTLNPYQLYPYYTIPHVLLFNLQNKQAGQIDRLVLYSLDTMERFIHIYPEKWLELCGHFADVLSISDRTYAFRKEKSS